MPSGRVRCLYRIKAARLVEQRQGDDEYAVGGFCIGTRRGNLNLICILLICNINIGFYFWLEYQLEYWTLLGHTKLTRWRSNRLVVRPN